jgi:hypothetical protein
VAPCSTMGAPCCENTTLGQFCGGGLICSGGSCAPS